MPDTKTTALTENTTPVSTDIIYMVDDPGGSALSQKMTLATMRTFIKATGGRELISEQTPTGTGTLSWASIPATYTSLEIEYVARSTQAAAYVDGSIYFNNDTTAGNYRTTGEGGYAINTNYVTGADDAAMLVGKIAAGTATAGYASYGIIKIPYYAKTVFHKVAINTFAVRRSDSGVETFTGTVSTFWESTVAINRVDITLSAGNYDTGSTFRLYGVY